MKLQDKRVLITGGSSGIGLAMAQSLLGKGARVVVTGRRPDVLAAAVHELKVRGGFVAGVAADVGTSEGRVLTLKQALDAGEWLAPSTIPSARQISGTEPDCRSACSRRKRVADRCQ